MSYSIFFANYEREEYQVRRVAPSETRIPFFTGRRISDQLPRLTMSTEDPRMPPDYFESISVLGVSQRLRACLESHGVRAEFIELDLLRQGRPWSGSPFYLMNPLDVIPCFDFSGSTYTKFSEDAGGGINSVERLLLTCQRLTDHHFLLLMRRCINAFPMNW